MIVGTKFLLKGTIIRQNLPRKSVSGQTEENEHHDYALNVRIGLSVKF